MYLFMSTPQEQRTETFVGWLLLLVGLVDAPRPSDNRYLPSYDRAKLEWKTCIFIGRARAALNIGRLIHEFR